METEMETMDRQEVWTNAFGDRFGERVCVGIEKGKCIHDGKKFSPTAKERNNLWNDFVFQEFGSKEQIQKDLDEEFGGNK